MRNIDFISASPHLTIFKTGTNQTYLGASLFLIYIIILLVLGVVYLYDYFSQNDYSVEYVFDKNNTKLADNEEIEAIRNMTYDFIFNLSKDERDRNNNDGDNYKDLSQNDNFLIINLKTIKNCKEIYDPSDGLYIIDSNDECVLKRKEKLSMSMPTLMVLYRCNKTKCYIRDEDKIKVDSYTFHFNYRGFSIDHQNSEKPIQLLPDDYYLYQGYEFLASTNIIYANWRIIQYEEKKGVFQKIYDKITGKKSTFYGTTLDSYKIMADDGHMKIFPDNNLKIKDKDGNHFILLLYLENYISLFDCDKYTRKAKSFLDALSNVFALGSTALHFFGLALSVFYSTNCDNYKIIENILKKNYNININKNKNEEEKENLSNIELKTDLIGNLYEESEEQNINIESDENIENENNEKSIASQDIDLPKLKFYDFLFHKLYFKCFGLSSKHSLINSCNDIVATYITIEKLISNQIKLDYLWKDYKWNNPQSEINERDDLILKLKEK